MVSKRTEYLDLAERIANNIEYDQWYCCSNLSEINTEKFYDMFFPHIDGGSQFFQPLFLSWMSCINSTEKEDNEHRVIALLLMHEMEVNP